MYNFYNDMFTKKEINTLLEYNNAVDHTRDDRPDVLSKSPIWGKDVFPQDIIQRALDEILEPYRIEVCVFYTGFVEFRLHVDGKKHEAHPAYKNVLVCLGQEGYAGTVVFNNHWHELTTRFSKSKDDPFRYSMKDKNGEFIIVEDIRKLYVQCLESPNLIKDFEVTETFISELALLIETRKKAEPRTNDYSNIINWDPEKKFDPEFHAKYLNHIPIEDLHGLTVATVFDWKPGRILTFDRTHLHCAARGGRSKTGIVILTDRLTNDNNPV